MVTTFSTAPVISVAVPGSAAAAYPRFLYAMATTVAPRADRLLEFDADGNEVFGGLIGVDAAILKMGAGAYAGRLFALDASLPVDAPDGVYDLHPDRSVTLFSSVGGGNPDPTGLAFGWGGSFGSFMYVANPTAGSNDPNANRAIARIGSDGTVLDALVQHPDGPLSLAFPTAAARPAYGDYLYFTLVDVNANRVMRVNAAGNAETFATFPAGDRPWDLAFGRGGALGDTLYVTVWHGSSAGRRLVRVLPDGSIQTIGTHLTGRRFDIDPDSGDLLLAAEAAGILRVSGARDTVGFTQELYETFEEVSGNPLGNGLFIDVLRRNPGLDPTPVSVGVRSVDGTAMGGARAEGEPIGSGLCAPGADFVIWPGDDVLEFTRVDAEDVVTLFVEICRDDIDEDDEEFYLELFDPTSGVGLDIDRVTVRIIGDAAGRLQFRNESEMFSERAGNVQIVVERAGGRAGDVGVDYLIGRSGDTAIRGIDWDHTIDGTSTDFGTLQFDDGVTEKTIDVTIIDNDVMDGNRTFTIELLNPPTGGATLGTPTEITAEITDDDFGADLGVEVQSAVTETEDGRLEVAFTITLSNSGPEPFASNVVVEATRSGPDIVDFVGQSSSHGDFDPAGNSWHLTSLLTDETATFVITYGARNPDDEGLVTLTASARADQADADPGNNSAASSAYLSAGTDIRVSFDIDDQSSQWDLDTTGPKYLRTIVTNLGPRRATHVVVVLECSGHSNVSCNSGTTVTFDNLQVGASVLATLALTAKGFVPNGSTITASIGLVESIPQDTNSSNNSASVGLTTFKGTGGGNFCFIATAAYGSRLDPHVVTLREFRDRRLLTNAPGRAFVAWYYRVSPPIAEWIGERDWARAGVRAALMFPVLAIAHPQVALALLVLLCAGMLARRSGSWGLSKAAIPGESLP